MMRMVSALPGQLELFCVCDTSNRSLSFKTGAPVTILGSAGVGKHAMHAQRVRRGNRSCDGQNHPAKMLLQTYQIDRLIYRFLRGVLPATRRGDAIYMWLHFLASHRRLPGTRESGRLNDLLYHVRVDGDLMDPLSQFVTDKVYAKWYVDATVGDRYTPKTLALLNHVDEVDGLRLTHFPCVVKPTHLSGEIFFCGEDDKALDRERMKRWFGMNLYWESREPNYRWLRPRVVVEEFFGAAGESVPDDYKVFCYRGEPRFIQVDNGRFATHTRNLYDSAWRRLPCNIQHSSREEDDARPEPLARMLEIASKLSAPFELMRVDLYVRGNEIRVGELTSCPGGGLELVYPAHSDATLGGLLLTGQAGDWNRSLSAGRRDRGK